VAPSLPDEPPLNSSSLGCALNAPLDLNLLHLKDSLALLPGWLVG
jgi:hypothetical protein